MASLSETNHTGEKKLPFLVRTHNCPACNAPGRHRHFRHRAHMPEKTESDGHVVQFGWSDPQFLQVHPPLYFLFFCPSCYFVAPSDDFAEPDSPLYGRTGSRVFAKARADGDPVIQYLGRKIDYESLTFETAIWMHLLAVYVHLLPEEKLRDHYTAARLYLRVAWLYREEAAGASRPKQSAAEPAEEVAPRAVVAALRDFDAVLHQGREARDTVASALQADSGRRGQAHAEVYDEALQKMARLLEALHSETYRIKTTFNRSYVVAAEAGERSHDAAVLEELKGLWTYAPADEVEAMRGAIENFEKAVASNPRLGDPEPFFRTAALIVDLELRCNDLDGAFKKVRGIVANVIKDRQAIQVRINETEDQSRKMELKRVHASASRSVELANDLYARVVELVIKREMPRITVILQEHAKSTNGQKKLALLSNGISHGIVTHLEKRNML